MKQQHIRRVVTALVAFGLTTGGTAAARACLFYGIPC